MASAHKPLNSRQANKNQSMQTNKKQSTRYQRGNKLFFNYKATLPKYVIFDSMFQAKSPNYKGKTIHESQREYLKNIFKSEDQFTLERSLIRFDNQHNGKYMNINLPTVVKGHIVLTRPYVQLNNELHLNSMPSNAHPIMILPDGTYIPLYRMYRGQTLQKVKPNSRANSSPASQTLNPFRDASKHPLDAESRKLLENLKKNIRSV